MIVNNIRLKKNQDLTKLYWMILTQIIIFIILEYYNDISFNNTFSDNQNRSLLHLNIRSVPLHFTECLSYFDTLNVNFKIIALSETASKSHHTIYRVPNYNL